MTPQAHVRAYGRGARPAHFIHCNLASGKAWEPLVRELADDLTISAIDMLGQGRSPLPDRGRDYQMQCAEASIAAMEAEGRGPCELVGHSFGATVALRVANLRPDLVRSLVLFEPIMFCFLDDAQDPMWAPISAGNAPFYDLLDRGETLRAAEEFLRDWGMPGGWDALPPEARQGFADKMWLVGVQRGAILDRNDWRLSLADLGALEMPVLIMTGGDSPPQMLRVAQIMADHIPQAELRELAGAGHMLPLTHPGPVAARMRAFWGAP